MSLRTRLIGVFATLLLTFTGVQAMQPAFAAPVDQMAEYGIQFDMGANHQCLVNSSGKVKCWGSNYEGQLGLGLTSDRQTPTQLSSITDAVQVSAGSNSTCAVLATGEIMCWGTNGQGQLGNGTTARSTSPVLVTGINTATQVSVGSNSTCAVLADGSIECWGANWYGQLGNGSTTSRTTPLAVAGISTAVEVSVGPNSACAVLVSGEVKCWGYNGQGQVGDGTNSSRYLPTRVVNISNASSVSVGSDFACAVRTDATLSCWGYNHAGQLGDGTNESSNFPVDTGLTGVRAVGAGDSNACAVLETGVAKCWGYNGNRQLGDGTSVNRTSPVSVRSIDNAVATSSNGQATCALLATGGISCWGNIYSFSNGGDASAYKTPTEITSVSGVSALALGGNSRCVLQPDATVDCWGYNHAGQLGDGSTEYANVPQTVPNLDHVEQLVGADYSYCALLDTGIIECWGENGNGQLGNGNITRQLSPGTVTGISNATKIVMSGQHACALLADGKVKCWGQNGNGQLGDGTSTQRTTAVEVSGLLHATDIAVGSQHSCAVLEDHTVRCWGANYSGQQGDMGQQWENGFTPEEVFNLENAVKVFASGERTCAIVTGGFLTCWGQNGNGQLGDGTTENRFKPTSIGITDVVDLAMSNMHTCAATSGGAVYCWGENSSFQLGDETTTMRKSPIQVEGISDATQVNVMYGLSCYLNTAGEVKCWGRDPGAFLFSENDSLRSAPMVMAVGEKIATPESTSVAITWGSSLSLAPATVTDFKVQYRVSGQQTWIDYDEDLEHASTTRATTIRNLEPSTDYQIRVWAIDDDNLDTKLKIETRTRDFAVTEIAGVVGVSTIALTWNIEHTGSQSVTDYEIAYRPSNRVGTNWTVVTDGVSDVRSANLTGLAAATSYTIRIRGKEGDSDTFSPGNFKQFETRGTGTMKFTVTDYDSVPIALGMYRWESNNGRFRSGTPRLGTTLGKVDFVNAVPGASHFFIDSARMVQGQLISGSWSLNLSAGNTALKLPAIPELVERKVRVVMPDGTPVPFAMVQVSGLSQQIAVSDESFSGTVTSTAATRQQVFTDANGEATLRGYVVGRITAKAIYSDETLYQETTFQPLRGGEGLVTELELEYMPVFTVSQEDIEAALNTVVTITLNVDGTYSGASTDGESGAQSVTAQSLGGIKVNIEAPRGSVQSACKGTKLSATTDESGRAQLKFCANGSGEYTIKSVGAVSSGAISVRVKNAAPMAPTALGAQSTVAGQALVAWGSPEYNGGSAITSYTVTAKSGSLTKTVKVSTGTTAFRNRTVTLSGLASNKVWTISVTATNAKGTSLASSTEVIVR